MTAISTIISKTCCAHSSDSLLTRRVSVESESKEVVEWLKEDRTWTRDPENGARETKIVRSEKHRGALTFWGLAQIGNKPTIHWLREKVDEFHTLQNRDEFTQTITKELNHEIGKMMFSRKVESGIGIHFTSYENRNGFWIPELFLITNWNDINYRSVADRVAVSRETYHQLSGEIPAPEHSEDEFRMKVREYLNNGGLFFYNNGDTELFNSAANGILRMFRTLAIRGWIDSRDSVNTYMDIASLPILTVSEAQEKFCAKGNRLIGGIIHRLGITPTGEFESDTGD